MPEYTEITIKGLDETFKKLREYGSVIQQKAAVDMTKAASGVFARAIRKNCPMKTGNLKKSIKSVRILKNVHGIIYYKVGFSSGKKVKHNGYYAPYVEFGSAPHTIPKIGKKMAALGLTKIKMKIGKNFFVGPIQHPGSKPTRFVTKSFEESYDKAIKTGQKAFDRALKKYK